MKKPLPVLVVGMFAIVLHAQDATRGATLYKQQCVSCHGGRLEGRSGPSLAGGDFQSRWPASDLIAKIRTTMPQDSPGTLTAGQASDLAAYILQAGKTAASAETATA
jgi:mono/diheme cytochrome c family protein